MRCTCYLPAIWHINLYRVTSGQVHRILLPAILLGIIFFILIITVADTNLLWRSAKLTEGHPLALKPTSIAVATDLSNPALHYGVVIDCGSSGSRVFVYFWPPHEGLENELLTIQSVLDKDAKPAVKKIEPGISAYADNPTSASDYIKPLLDFAAEHVPKEKHKETPLYVMATAGMRMLSEAEQNKILEDLRVDIPLQCEFVFTETHAEVISGKQEGVYAWVSLNFALGKFDHTLGDDPLVVVELPGPDKRTHIRKRTVGTMDMGGGSLQIAYEVPKSVRFSLPQEQAAKGLITEFNLGCSKSDVDHTYRVYVTTFLGFGANAVHSNYESDLIANATYKHYNTTTSRLESSVEPPTIMDPCLPKDYSSLVSVNKNTVHMYGSGDFGKCQTVLKPYLNKTIICEKKPCSMNGVYQPEIDFHKSEFYGFSEFYYSMEDILRMGGKYDYSRFRTAAKDYCSTSWDTIKVWIEKGLYPRANLRRYRLQCFKSAWMSLVLHSGVDFPSLYAQFKSVQYIEGREVHWTLGALLYKTRFYPLREIEKRSLQHEHYRPPWTINQLQHSYAVLIICVLVVLAAIFIYLRRLRIVRPPRMTRVPTMSYFMTEEGQMEEGLLSAPSPGLPSFQFEPFSFPPT